MKFRIFYFLSFTFFALSCDDSDEMGGNERALTVASFNSVQLGGNSVVRFDNSLTTNQSVLIKGNPGQVRSVTLEVINGTLLIRCSDDVQLSDSLTIIANPEILTGITLEAEQRAVVYWDDVNDICLDNLNIKTEANSMLGLFNICANSINIQQEAQSKVELESWFWQEADSIAILKSDAELIGDETYLINDNQIIVAETTTEIEIDGSTYVVFEGSEIKTFTVIPKVTAKLEAASELQADEMPVRNFDIRLEGESTAHVWVTDQLSGKGEGQSSLTYFGNPVIGYTTQGGASIQKD